MLTDKIPNPWRKFTEVVDGVLTWKEDRDAGGNSLTNQLLTEAKDAEIGQLSHEISVDKRSVLQSGGDGWWGRAKMDVKDNGDWVLVYREATEHANNDGVIHIQFSDDYGATWSTIDQTIGDNSISAFPAYPTGAAPGDAYGPGDPYIMVAPNGDLYLYTWKVDYDGSPPHYGTWQLKSTDGGATWGSWSQIDFGGITDDDNVIMTEDHFILDGDIYSAARQYNGTDAWKTMLLKSTDNGASWSKVSDITAYTDGSSGASEPGIEYLGNNEIIAITNTKDRDAVFKVKSTDMGQTWGTPEEIQDETWIWDRPRIYTIDHLKDKVGIESIPNWWEDYTLIGCGDWERKVSGNRRVNSIWLSEDHGENWSRPIPIDTMDEEDGGYGDLLINNSEQIAHISYQGPSLSSATLRQYWIDYLGENQPKRINQVRYAWIVSRTLIDDFEDGDISEYAGNTGDVTVDQTEPVYHGNYSAKIENVSMSGPVYSTSGLANYPSASATIRSRFYIDKAMRDYADSNFFDLLFGLQDSNNFFQVDVHCQGQYLKIFKTEGGTGTELQYQPGQNIPFNEWLTLEVQWHSNGYIKAYVLNDKLELIGPPIEVVAGEFQSGGIGFRANASNAKVSVDYLTYDINNRTNEGRQKHYHDRGDPSSLDFDTELGDLTLDGTWNDLDLSSIVPNGAQQVDLGVEVRHDVAGDQLLFRKNGNSYIYNKQRCTTGGYGNTTWQGFQVQVGCDSNQIIEYSIPSAVERVTITVKGWHY